MPDISMCLTKDCPKRNKCYRYIAIPSQWQSYFLIDLVCNDENNYEWFMDIDGRFMRINRTEKK